MQLNLVKLHPEGTLKTMRPSASKVVKRRRLLRKIDSGRECPLIWVSGPAGSGKTTLVSSFVEDYDIPHAWYKLDASDTDLATFFYNMSEEGRRNGKRRNNLPVFTTEYKLGIPEFSHKFFAGVFSNFNEGGVIVFDNYQELPEDLIFHDLLIDAIKLLPEKLQVIVISRKEPSSKFSRLKANRRICQLGWKDLRFTSKEFFEVVCRWGFEDLPEKTQNQIYTRMDGWITGLLFMLDGTKRYNTSLRNIGSGTFEDIFQYFAEETFDFQDLDVKHFLLRTSLLPNITPRLAFIMTGDEKAGQSLSCLCRNNLFIETQSLSENEAYQYHPLFQKYLQRRIEDYFTAEETNEIRTKTAKLLLIENRVEEAADIFLQAGDYQNYIEIINNHAQDLISKGRHSLLETWLVNIPPEIISENACLAYWAGICRQHTDPVAAKISFELAFEAARKQKNVECSFVSWAGLVKSIIHQLHDFTELDPLITWFVGNYDREWDGFSNELKCRLAVSVAECLTIRRPGNTETETWIEKSMEHALAAKDVELQMRAYQVTANYYLLMGNQSQSWMVLGQIRNLARSSKLSSLYVLKSKCLEANMYAWFLNDAEKCLQTVESALDIARSTGVHIVDHNLYVIGAFGALIAKKHNAMIGYLQKIEALLNSDKQHCYFCHHYLAAWLSKSKGNVMRGLTHAAKAMQTATQTGHVFHKALGIFVLAELHLEKGELEEGEKRLKEFEKEIEHIGSRILQYMLYLSKAQISYDLGRDADGEKYLCLAFRTGREEKYQNLLCWWNPDSLSRLSLKAIEKRIEVEFAKELIKRHNIVPDESPIELEHWPWPIKIYTLGRFEIVRDGEPVRFKGKAQQKPLAMLKALISLGGRGVPDTSLADALWPDADGDMQHQSLATTLHRLRKLLGGKGIVEFQDGHLSINSRYVWIDIWAFERLLSQAEKETKKNEPHSTLLASQYAEKAVRLYKGGFLAQNSSDHWCLHLRERLKSRFLRGVKLQGKSFEKLDKLENAAECYLQALEVDAMIEEFYQRLMICYHRMDRVADAVNVYKRCRRNLQSMLEVSPSSHTESIYKNLLAEPEAL